MNNLSSYCGLVDAKIRASDKDLPVLLQSVLFEIAYWYRYFTSLHAVIQCIFQVPMKTLILSMVFRVFIQKRSYIAYRFLILIQLSHNFLWEISQTFCFDKARPSIGAFLYKNFNDRGFSVLTLRFDQGPLKYYRALWFFSSFFISKWLMKLKSIAWIWNRLNEMNTQN